MRIKVFTLRLDPASGVFDDTEVESFLRDKLVLDVDQHFFTHERLPTWCLLVQYRDLDPAGGHERQNREDWRTALPASCRGLFDTIRQWRNDRATQQGRPPYVLLTNRQIAEIAQRQPKTKEALREIAGLGDARIGAFGAELLSLIEAAAGEVAVS